MSVHGNTHGTAVKRQALILTMRCSSARSARRRAVPADAEHVPKPSSLSFVVLGIVKGGALADCKAL
jgi:hypothetical protein